MSDPLDLFENLLNDAESLVRADGTIEPGYETLAAVTLGEIIAARRAGLAAAEDAEPAEWAVEWTVNGDEHPYPVFAHGTATVVADTEVDARCIAIESVRENVPQAIADTLVNTQEVRRI